MYIHMTVMRLPQKKRSTSEAKANEAWMVASRTPESSPEYWRDAKDDMRWAPRRTRLASVINDNVVLLSLLRYRNRCCCCKGACQLFGLYAFFFLTGLPPEKVERGRVHGDPRSRTRGASKTGQANERAVDCQRGGSSRTGVVRIT